MSDFLTPWGSALSALVLGSCVECGIGMNHNSADRSGECILPTLYLCVFQWMMRITHGRRSTQGRIPGMWLRQKQFLDSWHLFRTRITCSVRCFTWKSSGLRFIAGREMAMRTPFHRFGLVLSLELSRLKDECLERL
jgi:hypothetical protein